MELGMMEEKKEVKHIQGNVVSNPANDFFTKIRRDNWHDFTYDQRYLDALAAIFHVQGKCAAIVPYNDKFYLSYNETSYTIDKKGIKKEGSAFKIKKLIEENLNLQDIESLLFLYLSYNKNFTLTISEENLEQLYNVPEGLQNQLKHIYDMIIENTQKLIDDTTVQPLINNLLQQKVKIEEDIFKAKSEFNTLKEEILEQSNVLKHAIQGIQSKNSGKERQVFDPNKLKYLDIEDTSLTEGKKYPAYKYREIISSYFQLKELIPKLKNFSETESDGFLNLVKNFIRPLQDIEKLVHYVSEHYITVAVEIIDNPNSAHAETNLAAAFPKLGEDTYIGIAKLCCGACDSVLDAVFHYQHRGTHGLVDKWNAPLIQFQSVLDELKQKSKKFDQKILRDNYTTQDRDLSDDESFYPEDFIFNNTQFAFQQYKNECKLYGVDSESNE